MPIVNVNPKSSTTVWQETEDGVGEPAIIVSKYMGMVSLTQEGRYILVNFETIKALSKVMRDYANEP